MIDEHDEYCPTEGIAEHIAGIEAGWTLGKPWKASDEVAAERRNIEEVREMLARWEAHGIVVTYLDNRLSSA